MNFWYKVKEINFHSRHINVRHFGTAAIFDFVSPRIQSKENNIWKMTFWQRQWFSPRGRSTVIGLLVGRGSKSSYHDNVFHVGNNNNGLVLTILGDSLPFPWRFFRLSIMTAIRMINATKNTAPKDAATAIIEGEVLLLSSMMTLSDDFTSSVGVEAIVEDPRINVLIIDIKSWFTYPQ